MNAGFEGFGMGRGGERIGEAVAKSFDDRFGRFVRYKVILYCGSGGIEGQGREKVARKPCCDVERWP